MTTGGEMYIFQTNHLSLKFFLLLKWTKIRSRKADIEKEKKEKIILSVTEMPYMKAQKHKLFSSLLFM